MFQSFQQMTLQKQVMECQELEARQLEEEKEDDKSLKGQTWLFIWYHGFDNEKKFDLVILGVQSDAM